MSKSKRNSKVDYLKCQRCGATSRQDNNYMKIYKSEWTGLWLCMVCRPKMKQILLGREPQKVVNEVNDPTRRELQQKPWTRY